MLKCRILNWRETETSNSHLEELDLSTCIETRSVRTVGSSFIKRGGKELYRFELSGPKSVLKLASDSEDLRRDWVSSLSNATLAAKIGISKRVQEAAQQLDKIRSVYVQAVGGEEGKRSTLGLELRGACVLQVIPRGPASKCYSGEAPSSSDAFISIRMWHAFQEILPAQQLI